MKAERKHYSMKSLMQCAKEEFAKVTDLSKRSHYPLQDCLVAGTAMHHLKIKSLLRCLDRDKTLSENLQRIYKIAIPSDTHFRVRLDDIDPEELQPVYDALIRKLQRGKVLARFKQENGFYLVAIDKNHYFTSDKIHCKNCCIKHHADGRTTYYHQMLSATIVDPDKKQVLPLAIEPIIMQNDQSEKTCEQNAMTKLLNKLKRSHKHLKITILDNDSYKSSRLQLHRKNCNTPENQGYHLEHNYGHGYNNLSIVLCNLMFIAFLIDQIQEYCGYYFKQVLTLCRCKKYLWQQIREFIMTSAIESWVDLYTTIAARSIIHAS